MPASSGAQPRSRPVYLFAACAVLATAVTAAQDQAPPKRQTFRTRVDAVSVDVAATDGRGQPVADLTATDFEIAEDGKSQTIDSFKRVTLEDDPVALAGRHFAPITTLDAQEREAARDDVRLFAIFLDDYHTRLPNAARIRDTLASFVAPLPARDPVAVMTADADLGADLRASRRHGARDPQVRGRKYDTFRASRRRTPSSSAGANRSAAHDGGRRGA